MQQEESEHEHHHQSLILLKTCAKELLKYTTTRYLKITEKVAVDIASEASYVYILSGQKVALKIPKMVNFNDFLKT